MWIYLDCTLVTWLGCTMIPGAYIFFWAVSRWLLANSVSGFYICICICTPGVAVCLSCFNFQFFDAEFGG